MANIVAIVGRPNVGKSTLFNRLTDSRKAIVDEVAGVTRDRHYGKSEWNGLEFSVIDTGGYVHGSDDIFEGEIRKQVQLAIDESSVILFVVDVTDGITDDDKIVADMLRRGKKKVFVVSNKVDNGERQALSGEFYALGLGEVHNVSAISGSGTGDLLDEVVAALDKNAVHEEIDIPKFAIVGRPNVGKSSTVNALLGKEQNIVTNIAGTTRDSINTRYTSFGHDFLLIDTAGIRKKSKVEEDLEFYSVMRSIRSIEDCDVCLLLIDATLGMEAQDLNIFHLAEKNRKGIVIMVNKWDLVEKNTNSTKEYEERIRERIAPFRDVPIIFTSAITKQRVLKAIEAAEKVYANRIKSIKTRELNDVMLPIIESNPPSATKGKEIKIKFINQLPTHAPTFAFYCNLPQYVTESYIRFLENRLREKFDFSGVPIQLFMRKK
ncbi:MAG: ribosome biogenesis GTPase Der [Bacteroidia bacterium]|nr:ribosome biogenesis GTPase Der [Bacteroidia bacterium]MCC6837395.1 ribosome biogenesis GTPase Der [Bacteroidia bacterium]